MTSFSSEIDKHVGQRMRMRREALRISQGRLGRHLGVTFSQVQKYEKGSNRVGAGRLYQIALFLGVSPNYFYEGLKSDGDNDIELPDGLRAASADEVRQLTQAFSIIEDKDTRDSIMALVRSLSSELHKNALAR